MANVIVSSKMCEPWLGDVRELEVEAATVRALIRELDRRYPGLGEQVETSPGNCVPVFGIANLDAARAKLEQAGVSFDGATEVIEGMVKTATFYDPDGNALMLAEDLTGAA